MSDICLWWLHVMRVYVRRRQESKTPRHQDTEIPRPPDLSPRDIKPCNDGIAHEDFPAYVLNCLAAYLQG